MDAATLKRRVLASEPVHGAMIFECFTPGIAQIMANAGCDFVLYDMEHTGVGIESMKWQVACCRGLGIVPLARPPRGEYRDIATLLDVGMAGVMIPMVESAAQARAIVEAAHYPPRGRRGAAFGFAHDAYKSGPPADKITAAAEATLVIAQIETERGLAHVEEIAAVEGIDVLWVGHFDLTNFLGIPGAFDDSRFTDALDRIVKAGRAAGKGLGFLPGDAATAAAYADRGFNMLAAGTDMALLASGVRTILDGAASANSGGTA
ncbi:MAG: aldolase/citrate lyase family protein [Pseudomonadota bacterium]